MLVSRVNLLSLISVCACSGALAFELGSCALLQVNHSDSASAETPIISVKASALLQDDATQNDAATSQADLESFAVPAQGMGLNSNFTTGTFTVSGTANTDDSSIFDLGTTSTSIGDY